MTHALNIALTPTCWIEGGFDIVCSAMMGTARNSAVPQLQHFLSSVLCDSKHRETEATQAADVKQILLTEMEPKAVSVMREVQDLFCYGSYEMTPQLIHNCCHPWCWRY